jgi:hypothetical protein
MRREIELTKELAKRLQRKFPNFKVYANKCPSRSSRLKKLWFERFHEQCPPLQPEMDMIIYEPSPCPKIRSYEIKYFEKVDGVVNQSFYKGIEQALALVRWGFDSVALWQLFDETFSEDDLRNYGCRTWLYIHGILDLPIGFTMLWLKGEKLDTMRFRTRQCEWGNNLKVTERLDIDDPEFPFSHRPLNPLIIEKILYPPLEGEVSFLRDFLLEWLPKKSQGLT